jgi:Aldo/keto reductases, related to diketogulonate reductase
MDIPAIPLNTGAHIPQVGAGTWPLDDTAAADTVQAALELGYRHLDTAHRYRNEAGVGEGIRRVGLPREELFVTTKLDGEWQGDDRAIAGLRGSLERLGLDYVDLLLIHWPLPARDEYVSTWRIFEKLHADGLARAIGVSNFKPAHLDRLAAETTVVPAVNQIQISPAIPRRAQRVDAAARGIVTESWSPLGGQSGATSLLADPVVTGIAERLGRTPAQVVLRWHVQQGLVVIPKSATRKRLAENLDLFTFELSEDDLAALATLDGGPDAGVDSDRDGH